MKFEWDRRIKTLDIGIGRGGWYLNNTGRTTAGVEKHFASLQWLRERYGVKGVIADALQLPFKDHAFSEINIFYPHDNVIYALSSTNEPLWSELHRVLKPDGFIDIIFDVYPNKTRVIDSGVIPNVLDSVLEAARKASFTTFTQEVTDDYLKRIGSRFARMATDREKEISDYKSYRIIGAKIIS